LVEADFPGPAILPAPQPAGEPKATLTVAALPFTVASGDSQYAPLADAIGDMVINHLSGAEGIQFVERSELTKILREYELKGVTSEATQVQIGKMAGAHFVLTGSVTAIDDGFQINAHLAEVTTTRILKSAKADGNVEDLFSPTENLARALVVDLDRSLPELSPDQIDQSPDSNMNFMRGLSYYFAKLHHRATTQFLKAIAGDPENARARFWNAMNYYDQSEYEHAEIEFTQFIETFGTDPLTARARQLLKQSRARIGKTQDGPSQ
jgi:TolB-like protein